MTTKKEPELIAWPDEYSPSETPIHAANDASTSGSSDTVWSLIIHAPAWPSFYPHATNIRIVGGGDALSLGAIYGR
jgi:hypothetical protein